MLNFRDFIFEDAGNLKGLPKLFIKEIVKGWDHGAGGKNSKIELYKENAKQKDVTAAAKKVGGWVKPSDKGYRTYSRAEIEAEQNKKNYAAVLIKIDGEWAYLAKWDEYGEGAAKFQLLADKGNVTVKRWNQNKYTRRSNMYDSPYLKATEISDYIDFKNSKVDVYLVTADKERLKKQMERKEAREVPEVSKEKREALKKFLNKKSGGLVDEIKKSLEDEVQSLTNIIEKMFSDSINNEKYDGTSEYKKILSEIEEKFKTAERISYYFNSIVKQGTIKETYSNELSWDYKRFLEMVEELKKKGDIEEV